MNIMRFVIPKSMVEYVTEDSTVRQGIEKMRFHRYVAIPVLDKEGRYIGTLRNDDILNYLLGMGSFDSRASEREGVINIIGGILTCAMIFMPHGNTFGFLALFFISYLGRIIVDNAVPTMLFPLIDPKIAGSYNAWRCVLYNLCSIIATPIISVLVEKVDPLWLLIPGTVTYAIVTVWYYIVCKKLTKA